jgi:hypothetical protein
MGRTAFIVSILVNAGLASFIATVSVGPLYSSGESWLGIAFIWVLALPVMLVLSISAGSRAYPRYREASSTSGRMKIYSMQVVWISAVSMLAVAILVWAESRIAA